MTRPWRNFGFIFMASSVFGLLKAQPVLTCHPPPSRPLWPGKASLRDWRYSYELYRRNSGRSVTGIFPSFLNVNITNHLSGNTVTDVVFTVDNGSGPQSVNTPGMLVATINWSITG